MDAKQSQEYIRAFGFTAVKPLPSIPESLKGIAEGLKTLGDEGIPGAAGETVKGHLAAVLSQVNHQIAQKQVAKKITDSAAAGAARTVQRPAAPPSRPTVVPPEPLPNVPAATGALA
jgi:hypothetical protein